MEVKMKCAPFPSAASWVVADPERFRL